ncbi:MAG TPA: DUF418 domain-containing protein [Allosphingosinicella sp.]|nr:DUF418 domain-containing protein [Allosphingosinicella sp.]
MTQTDRILTLDVLRGVAVMGIFSVNVIAFAMPEQAYFNPSAYGGATGASLATWALNFILIDGKMRGLFSLLFGASTLLVITRAEAAGLDPRRVHFTRMAWLLVFGLCHFFLLWYGDILTLYAVMGFLLWPFRNRPVRTLLYWAVGLLLVDLAAMTLFAFAFVAAEAAAHAPHATAAAVTAWNEMGHEFSIPAPDALARDLALYRGHWTGIVAHRIHAEWNLPLIQLLLGGAETLGYMLLGMAGLKSGFLTGAWEARRYRRIAALGLAIGVPAFALLAWNGWRSGFGGAIVFVDAFAAAAPFRLAMMAAYAALIVLLARNAGWLRDRIAAAGRAAFTNYLGATLFASLLFDGYGLGLYGHIERWQAWLVAPCFWAAMLAWSKAWLDRYRYGPFEWLWRSLSRWSPQPMRRALVAA